MSEEKKIGGRAFGETLNVEKFIEEQVALIREQVGDGKVLLALSGGVDSSVVARCCSVPSAISSTACM